MTYQQLEKCEYPMEQSRRIVTGNVANVAKQLFYLWRLDDGHVFVCFGDSHKSYFSFNI